MNVLQKTRPIKLAVLLLLAAGILGVGGYWLQTREKQPVHQAVSATNVPSPKVSDTVTYVAEPGASVLDQLKRVAKVETKETSYGTLVQSVNGMTNGADGKYWLFYVDGQMADKGADAYVTKGGEAIEWKFSK